ncbi:MAG: aspartyl/glutamyl-tRNA amidotransferase subunit C [Gemmatimonadetes bacterium]|jgi:aspartyl-tRNA(Asn)/glutamyl-tRNA(Gln) amidotransferase subunit C|nr:aspartyl/glutamyl-tRNA amidotransferase subunit C [Gemmatimonadota bacterium]
MSITREEILQIATLARLRLTDSESEDLSQDLSQILEYVDTLASLQVPEGERFELGPPEAPERKAGQMAPDAMAHPPTDSAPDFRDGFFVVPSPPSLGGADDSGGSP